MPLELVPLERQLAPQRVGIHSKMIPRQASRLAQVSPPLLAWPAQVQRPRRSVRVEVRVCRLADARDPLRDRQ